MDFVNNFDLVNEQCESKTSQTDDKSENVNALALDANGNDSQQSLMLLTNEDSTHFQENVSIIKIDDPNLQNLQESQSVSVNGPQNNSANLISRIVSVNENERHEQDEDGLEPFTENNEYQIWKIETENEQDIKTSEVKEVPSNRAIIVLDDFQDDIHNQSNQSHDNESKNDNGRHSADFLTKDLNSDETKIATAHILQNLFNSQIDNHYISSPSITIENKNPAKVVVNEKEETLIKRCFLLDHNYAAFPDVNTTITKVSPKSSSPNELFVSNYAENACNHNEEDISHRLKDGQIAEPVLDLSVNIKLALEKSNDNISPLPSDDDKRHDSDGEETETAPENEFENSVTRCICDYVHDDGYMICCDKCSVWQHVDCMGIDKSSIPDDYLCEECNPRFVDKQWARELQSRKRIEILRNSSRQAKYKPIPAKKAPQSRRKWASKKITNSAPTRKASQPRRSYKRRKRNSISSSKENEKSRKNTENFEVSNDSAVLSSSDNDNLLAATTTLAINTSNAVQKNVKKWVDNYEEAVFNYYSAEFQSKIINSRINGSLNSINLPSYIPERCKLSLKTPGCIKILMSLSSISINTPVIELKGRFMLLSEYYEELYHSSYTNNQYVFYYHLSNDKLDICVDTNTYGNDARFVRRSCRPNTELRHCIDKGKFYLFLVTISHIDKNTELTIKHDSYSNSSEILPCACGNVAKCLMKKFDVKDTLQEKTKQSMKISPIPKMQYTRSYVRRSSSMDQVDNSKNDTDDNDFKESSYNETNNNIRGYSTVIGDQSDSEKSLPPSPFLKKTRQRRSSKSATTRTKDNESPNAVGSDEKMSREDRKIKAILQRIAKMEKPPKRKKPLENRRHDTKQNSSNTSDTNNSHDLIRTERKKRKMKMKKNGQMIDRRKFKRKDEDNNSIQNAAGTLLELASGKISDSSLRDDLRDVISDWLNKPNDLLLKPVINQESKLFNNYMNGKNLETLVHAASLCLSSSLSSPSASFGSQPLLTPPAVSSKSSFSLGNNGNAKKRWLRQAIREEEYQSPSSPVVTESLSLSNFDQSITPLKKRRLARESISSDHSITPPGTPINSTQLNSDELEASFTCFDYECKDNFGDNGNIKNSSVEETVKVSSPVKKKLSITEYLQRKKTCTENDTSNEQQELANVATNNRDSTSNINESLANNMNKNDQKNYQLEEGELSDVEQDEVCNNQNFEQKLDESKEQEEDLNESDSESVVTNDTSLSPEKNDGEKKKKNKLSFDENHLIFESKDSVAFSSAPTLLELQAELQTERLKKAFGLLESISLKSLKSPSIEVQVKENNMSENEAEIEKYGESVEQITEVVNDEKVDNNADKIIENNISNEELVNENRILETIVSEPVEEKIDKEEILPINNCDVNYDNSLEKIVKNITNDSNTPATTLVTQHTKCHSSIAKSISVNNNNNNDYSFPPNLQDDNFDFVPPFNNPIYPNSFTFPHLSVILNNSVDNIYDR